MRIYCLALVLLTIVSCKSVYAQGSNCVAKVLLYHYLNAEGKANNWHFTIEDYPKHTHFDRCLVDVYITNKNITSFSGLKAYLLEQLPGITVSMEHSGVISIIENSLINDPKYALNKSVACDYDGSNYDLIDYLSPLVGNSLLRQMNHMRSGGLHLPPDIHLSIHTKGKTLRSIFTAYLPSSTASVILWNALTDDSSGKETTYFQSAGEEI